MLFLFHRRLLAPLSVRMCIQIRLLASSIQELWLEAIENLIAVTNEASTSCYTLASGWRLYSLTLALHVKHAMQLSGYSTFGPGLPWWLEQLRWQLFRSFTPVELVIYACIYSVKCHRGSSINTKSSLWHCSNKSLSYVKGTSTNQGIMIGCDFFITFSGTPVSFIKPWFLPHIVPWKIPEEDASIHGIIKCTVPVILSLRIHWFVHWMMTMHGLASELVTKLSLVTLWHCLYIVLLAPWLSSEGNGMKDYTGHVEDVRVPTPLDRSFHTFQLPE